MKGFLFGILFVVTCGIAYVAYRDGSIAALVQGYAARRAEPAECREPGVMSDADRDFAILSRRTYITRGCATYADPENPYTWMDLSEDVRQRRESRERWNRTLRTEDDIRSGRMPSGIPDIDDAVIAGNRLDYVDTDHWPLERIAHVGAARTLWNAVPQNDPDGRGPSEECVDWQGRDAGKSRAEARPQWVDHPTARERVSTPKAIQRFLFGTADERL